MYYSRFYGYNRLSPLTVVSQTNISNKGETVMAKKKKIEIEECTCAENKACTCEPEEEKKAGFWNTGFWAGVASVAGVTALVLHSIWKLEKEDEPPKAANDMFKAPSQPIVPHIEPVEVEDKPAAKPVTRSAAPAPKKEAPKKEAPAAPADDVVLPPYDAKATFVGNYDTKVFHKKDCRYADQIAKDRKVSLYSVEEAFAADYKPCGVCKPNGTGEYVCNTESMVFHKADCASVKVMLDDKKYFMGTRDAAIKAKYKPCGRCKP